MVDNFKVNKTELVSRADQVDSVKDLRRAGLIGGEVQVMEIRDGEMHIIHAHLQGILTLTAVQIGEFRSGEMERIRI